jgi:aspartyl-tRNA(Asn)/glutamyl-tRNA(Gln) amidotransferase subunit A
LEFRISFQTVGNRLPVGQIFLQGYVSPYDATVIERMRNAGWVWWRRLNMDEYAMGSSNENSY